MWNKPFFTHRVCMCGRQIESVYERKCDFCIATENADADCKGLIEDILHNGTPPTAAEMDEAQAINDAINKYVPLMSEQREPIRQPQANAKWGRKG